MASLFALSIFSFLYNHTKVAAARDSGTQIKMKDGFAAIHEQLSPSLPSPPSSSLTMIMNRRSIFPKQFNGVTVPQNVIEDMLVACTWAPTHHLTQPVKLVRFSGAFKLKNLGQFLADEYKRSTPALEFSQTKFEKKIKNAQVSSEVFAICVKLGDTQRPPTIEEVCSVACSVQNMHLVASEHRVGAYWSSGLVYDTNSADAKKLAFVVNPPNVSVT